MDKEKPVELEGMIQRINDAMPDFLEKYGVKAIEIPSSSIHVQDKSKLDEKQLTKLKKAYGGMRGFHSAVHQGIALFKDYQDGDKLSFLQTLVHEMLHVEGFYSFQASSPEFADMQLKKGDKKTGLNIRRSGFSIGTLDGKQLLFHELNEAVITELAIRFERAYFNRWPEIAEEMRNRDEYMPYVSRRENISMEEAIETIASVKKDKSTDPPYSWVSYSYHHARKEFRSLIDALYERNTSEFSSKEEIFDLFATATMTGRLLPVARLIESTFGKGAFREIGENSTKDTGRNRFA